MNILLVYPETPATFWSFKNALKFVSKKSSEPPLGLLTIAGMLPEFWNKKLVDMNVSTLEEKHIRWADYVFLSGMNVQKQSFMQVIKLCNELDTKIVAGGPLATMEYENFLGVDHFVLNEAEVTLPLFLADLKIGHAERIYKSDQFPDISSTPVPMWEILEMDKYSNMSLQFSRGCPFNCDFCCITMLNGHTPRTKNTEQFLTELDTLYKLGWSGGVFVVDDNFIGNKRVLKSELLPALVNWSKERDYPFSFYTEVSINIADDQVLMDLMVEAGFDHTFIGIETVNESSLIECGKKQNQNRDLVDSVKKLHHSGLRVSGGFIVGFDNDTANIFEQQILFIKNSGIVTAMVGLLNAPNGTKLFERLKSENRLINFWTGNNMDGNINFVPKMNYQSLIRGYKDILKTVYAPAEYYSRVKSFLQEYTLPGRKIQPVTFTELKAFIKSIWVLGILEKGQKYYWKLLLFSLLKYPQKISLAITLAIYGFHFRKVTEGI